MVSMPVAVRDGTAGIWSMAGFGVSAVLSQSGTGGRPIHGRIRFLWPPHPVIRVRSLTKTVPNRGRHRINADVRPRKGKGLLSNHTFPVP